MPKRLQLNPLKIKSDVVAKALRYALSKNEVGFLFFGKGDTIIAVERIRNNHPAKGNRFLWDMILYRSALKKYDYDFYIEGHSHSKDHHLRHPSKDDVYYFKKGRHIIVFPKEKTMRCWRFQKNLKITLDSEITIQLTKNPF